MAIWQKSYTLIPKISRIQFNKEDFDEEIYWETFNFTPSEFEGLGLILPKSVSWSKNITLYGSEDSNCIEIYSSLKKIESFSMRINFSQPYEELLRNLVEYFMFKDLSLIDSNTVEELNFNFLEIDLNIKNSEAYYKHGRLLNGLNPNE